MVLGDENLDLILSEESPVCRAWYDKIWFYSVLDIIAVLA